MDRARAVLLEDIKKTVKAGFRQRQKDQRGKGIKGSHDGKLSPRLNARTLQVHKRLKTKQSSLLVLLRNAGKGK